MLKLILLILCGTFCVAHAGRTRRSNHVVTVEVDMPWHIKFSIPLMGKFEPLSLQAKIRNTNEKLGRNVEFMSHKEGSNLVFKNKNPLRLVVDDVMYADLEYKSGAQSPPMRIAFNYVIKNKQFDVLYLNTEVEYDAETEDAKIAAEDYAEDVTDTTPTYARTTTTTKPRGQKTTPKPEAPMPALAPAPTQQNDLDSTCFTQDEIIMKDAEKNYLEAQLETALDIGNIGTRLILTGSLPPGNNAADAIRALVTDKLQLPHLKESILQARFVQQELLFEVDTPKHKVEILTLARVLLKRSPYKIESTDRDVFEVSQLARGSKLL